eukprot:scaffold11394_cov183-Amphora_coffeaeformis.AAC.10
MPKTLEGGPWDYLPVLNECIKILLTVMIGAIAGRFGALEAKTFVPQAVKFVFQVRTVVAHDHKGTRRRSRRVDYGKPRRQSHGSLNF